MSLFGDPEGIPCCCLSGCCPETELPECVTLTLESSCCPGDVAVVVLTREDALSACDGGEQRPTTGASAFGGGDITKIWTGALPDDWCAAAEIGDATVNVFCRTDPETGEQSWWIYIADSDLGHNWYNYTPAPQYHELILVSCDPFLLQIGATLPDCSSESCIWTWQAACFIAGTTVDTPSGLRDIKDLKPGDMVLDIHGEPVTVLEVIETEVSELVCLRGSCGFDTGVTPEHPFFLADMQTTVEAGSLKSGDVLPLGNTVTSTHREMGKFTVYNLSVSGSNSFIADGYAVHNKGNL